MRWGTGGERHDPPHSRTQGRGSRPAPLALAGLGGAPAGGRGGGRALDPEHHHPRAADHHRIHVGLRPVGGRVGGEVPRRECRPRRGDPLHGRSAEGAGRGPHGQGGGPLPGRERALLGGPAAGLGPGDHRVGDGDLGDVYRGQLGHRARHHARLFRRRRPPAANAGGDAGSQDHAGRRRRRLARDRLADPLQALRGWQGRGEAADGRRNRRRVRRLHRGAERPAGHRDDPVLERLGRRPPAWVRRCAAQDRVARLAAARRRILRDLWHRRRAPGRAGPCLRAVPVAIRRGRERNDGRCRGWCDPADRVQRIGARPAKRCCGRVPGHPHRPRRQRRRRRGCRDGRFHDHDDHQHLAHAAGAGADRPREPAGIPVGRRRGRAACKARHGQPADRLALRQFRGGPGGRAGGLRPRPRTCRNCPRSPRTSRS